MKVTATHETPSGILPIPFDTGSPPPLVTSSLRGELFRVAENAVSDVVIVYAVRRSRIDSATQAVRIRIAADPSASIRRVARTTISDARAWLIDVEIAGRRLDAALGRGTFALVGERIAGRATYDRLAKLFATTPLAARRRYRDAVPLLYFELSEKGIIR